MSTAPDRIMGNPSVKALRKRLSGRVADYPFGTGQFASCVEMEQSGFRPDQQQARQGPNYGWQGFLAALEQVLPRID